MEITEYYKFVKRTQFLLHRDLLAGKYAGQPTEFDVVINDDDGSEAKKAKWLYITSIENRDKNTTAGSVCVATVSHAARLIADNTHRVSTEDEIDKELEAQLERRKIAQEEDARRELQKMRIVHEDAVSPLSRSLRDFVKKTETKHSEK